MVTKRKKGPKIGRNGSEMIKKPHFFLIGNGIFHTKKKKVDLNLRDVLQLTNFLCL